MKKVIRKNIKKNTYKRIILFILILFLFNTVPLHSLSVEGKTNTFVYLNTAHPRILLTADKVNDIKKKINNDDVKKWYLEIKTKGDELISKPYKDLPNYNGESMAYYSEKVYDHISTLGFLYQIEEDKVLKREYADRVYEEIMLITSSNFPDWDTEQILDLGNFAKALAYAYDWFYSEWNATQKSYIKNTIVKDILNPGLNEYYKYPLFTEMWWKGHSYWGPQISGGLGAAALAIADEEKELSYRVVYKTIETLAGQMRVVAPNGNYAAGLDYWDKFTSNLTVYIATLETAIGDDSGLGKLAGYSTTGDFPIYMESFTGKSFNFAENDEKLKSYPQLLYLGNRFNKGYYIKRQFDFINKNGNPSIYDIMWINKDKIKNPLQDNVAKDMYFGLDSKGVDFVTFRSGWENPYGIATMLKGGNNFSTEQAQLDLGSFYIDALGERWVEDLGPEDSSLPGMYSFGPNEDRWKYYKNRAEANNTLVINPTRKVLYDSFTMLNKKFSGTQGSEDQDIRAQAKFVGGGTSIGDAFTVVDLSSAYKELGGESVKRGLKLYDHRRKILLQDEIKLEEKGELWWFMNTKAKIDITKDGREALLIIGDKRMKVKMLEPQKGIFKVLASEPLATSPKAPVSIDEQSIDDEVKRLAIHIEDIEETTIAISFEPLRIGEDSNSDLSKIIPLNKWIASEDKYYTLNEILVDGKPLNNFKSDYFTYDLKTSKEGKIPFISVNPNEKNKVTAVKQAESIPGVAVVEVSSEFNPQTRSKYLIYLSGKDNSNINYKVPVERQLSEEGYKIRIMVQRKEHVIAYSIFSTIFAVVSYFYFKKIKGDYQH